MEALLDYGSGKTGYLYATTAEWPGEDRYEFTPEDEENPSDNVVNTENPDEGSE